MKPDFRISTDAELKKLFERLQSDIVEAGCFLRLHKTLAEKFHEFRKEVDQTPAFWSFTAKAVREGALFRLSRIYDQHTHALSLAALLHTIAQHKRFFHDDAVLKRVGEAYAKSFRPGSHEIDVERLEQDIGLVSSSDPLVLKIIRWRSNFGAHLSTKPILRPQVYDGLTREEAEQLVDRAYRIYNRYLTSFEATSVSTMVIGESSHDFVFKLLRLGLQKLEDDYEAQWK
jgi:hypothetical protein